MVQPCLHRPESIRPLLFSAYKLQTKMVVNLYGKRPQTLEIGLEIIKSIIPNTLTGGSMITGLGILSKTIASSQERVR